MDVAINNDAPFDDTSSAWVEYSEHAHPPASAETPAIDSKLNSRLHNFAVDIVLTSLVFMLPNALSWAYRTLCTRQITCFKIESKTSTSSKTANLFQHTSLQSDPKNTSAVLLMHGDHSHPFSLLHLADIAQEEGKTVFSVHLPYSDEHPEIHQSLLRQSIEKIQQLVQEKGGSLTELIAVGHSRGAIEASHAAYVEENPQITKVISLASRLKVIENTNKPCRPTLKDTVNAVYEKIMKATYPPLYQLSGEYDWNADLEASQVKPDNALLVKDAMHTNVLFFPETLDQFRLWMRT